MEFTMKYVRFLDVDGEDSIIVFSNNLVHREVALRLFPSKILGAGFVRVSAKVGGPVLVCYGRSESLNVDSNPEDTKFLRASLEL